jgi:excisionase family DNA binding protein
MPEYVTLEQASDRYGVSRSTLFRWIREGKLSGFRKARDRHTYVDGAAVRRLLRYPLIPGQDRKESRGNGTRQKPR